MSNKMKFSSIDNPEFINLQPLDINPLMSECEIKVLYIGQNRNHSYISKDVATEMSKTLRGAPIVGWYKEQKEDFGDHGDRMIFDGDGIRFECLTKPYGFVAPDAKVWFQKFKESDDFGNEVEREYLMTTGYLWTGQFTECQDVIERGRPHSMELDEKTLNGKWSTDINSNMEFFIINDAVFSKLCILGEDVEPCFEGSSITSPEVSRDFTKVDDDFKRTLFTMMEELKFALQKGGTSMAKETEIQVEQVTTDQQEKFSVEKDKVEQNTTEENQKFTEEGTIDTSFANNSSEDDKKKKEEEEDKSDNSQGAEGGNGDNKKEEDDEEDKDKKPQTKNSLENEDRYDALQQQYNELNNKYTELQDAYQGLIEFKNQIDNEKKDALINSFYMLSDEDKKDVVENKTNYTLDEIEAKLSIIYTKKQFALEGQKETQKQEDSSQIVTYNLKENEMTDNAPDWVKAVRETEVKLHS